MAETVVVAGALAQMPGHGGLSWVFLQYLLGFKQLGWNVLFLDQVDPAMCVDAAGERCAIEDSANLAYFDGVMTHFGLRGDYSLSYGQDTRIGLSREQVEGRARDAALLINIMGVLRDPDILALPQQRVFLDIDPGFGQMWRELGLADPFAGHDAFVTIGENIYEPGCGVPTCGLEWITTPQPVVLDYWPVSTTASDTFTTVASWRGLYGPIQYRGKTYGLRVHEFRKFIEMPRRAAKPFRVALDIDPADARDLALLDDNGWVLDEPRTVAGDPLSYQRFIAESGAEFAVAKNLYVETASGWLSDRTLCYLASGKPAVVQDTGLRDLYPTGEGLLTFSTMDEAIAATDAIAADPARHGRAARGLAEAYFDSGKVLPRLLGKLGVA